MGSSIYVNFFINIFTLAQNQKSMSLDEKQHYSIHFNFPNMIDYVASFILHSKTLYFRIATKRIIFLKKVRRVRWFFFYFDSFVIKQYFGWYPSIIFARVTTKKDTVCTQACVSFKTNLVSPFQA